MIRSISSTSSWEPAALRHQPGHGTGTKPPAPPAPGDTTGTTPPHGDIFDGLQDAALLKAINKYTSPHTVISYTAARKAIFTDVDVHDGKVRDVYSHKEIPGGKIPSSSVMNAEHTWPQSKGATGAAKSDLHHIFPADSKANSIRGNYPFGIVTKVKWQDPSSGAKFGTDANGKTVFEPPADHKGNVARAMFYFAATYNKHIDATQEAILKEWNKEDPVDAAEVSRNDAIEKYQKNRNPFVDESDLADRIADF